MRANQALYDLCLAYDLPLISGKDSMKNDYGRGKNRISVPPTLLVTIIGPVADSTKSVTMDFKNPGDKIYVLGLTCDELGASEYYHMLEAIGNTVPKVDAAANLNLYRKLFEAIQKNLLRSVHDCSDGGLWVSLAESSLAGRLGCEVDLSKMIQDGGLSDIALLFSESQGRFVVSVSPQNAKAFESALQGSAMACIGDVISENTIQVNRADKVLIQTTVEEVLEKWQPPLNL